MIAVSEDGQAGVEAAVPLEKIEEAAVTPGMIEAGAAVLRRAVHEQPHHDFEELASFVFRAMQNAGGPVRDGDTK
jgi:hypothetical protein